MPRFVLLRPVVDSQTHANPISLLASGNIPLKCRLLARSHVGAVEENLELDLA